MNIFEFIKSIKEEINVFLEIGTHFGNDTLEFRNILPNTRIISFEPDPRNIEMLKKVWPENFKVEFYNLAVSNYNGKTDMYLSSGDCSTMLGSKTEGFHKTLIENTWSASNSLKKPKLHLNDYPWVKFDEKIEVDCVKLDDFEPISETKIDFIWADVQGAEDLVFGGAKQVLKRTKYIYTEYSSKELYEDQLNLNNLLKLMGGDWQIVYDYGTDVLLKNKTL